MLSEKADGKLIKARDAAIKELMPKISSAQADLEHTIKDIGQKQDALSKLISELHLWIRTPGA